MKILIPSVIAIVGLAIVNTGCDRAGEVASAGVVAPESLREGRARSAPPGLPQDFFPVKTGTSWRYEVRLGPAEPLGYREVHWDDHGTCTRSRLVRDFEEAQTEAHFLELRVKGTAAQPAEPLYPNGVELELVQDDLKLFGDAKRLFFATKSQDGFEVVLVATYSAESDSLGSGGPWGRWGQQDGYAMRMFFFGEKPGTCISFGKNPSDRLLFVGVEEKHPQLKGGPFLHFKRMVDASKRDFDRERDHIDSAFTEDTWFSNHGLVRLEQRVGGVRSMVWTLVGSRRADEPPLDQGTRRPAGNLL